MAPQLSPCPACQRHIRINEQSCPFCAARVEVGDYGTTNVSYLREHVTAIFVGVTLVMAGCNTSTEPSKLAPVEVKPQTAPVTPPTTGSALVPPPTTLSTPPIINAAPAYGLAPKPRPANKYGAPPYKKPKTPFDL
jgi:hypothetical protein